ncbi:cd7 antigen-like [Melanotaenia boesemani]|uniref:cd7 antigen-like n=1 Tax=Melanotaenia boesemani TaxID=1250792 RepID=UPI001C03C903|nr:cd7 antigen-like [Melanotaenia boesemani]
MKTHPTCVLLFLQLVEANAQLVFKHLKEGQSLGLSLVLQQDHSSLAGLHLYHRGAQSQTTLLSLAEGRENRVDSGLQARLQLRGGLKSIKINVSIAHLQRSDTGLYMWEMRYREENGSHQIILDAQKIFLLVEEEGTSCQCSNSYVPLLMTMSAAAGLLLLAFSWMIIERCVKAKNHQTSQPHAPIYEEMSRKQPPSPENNHRASSHLEEVNFPVYANPNIRQPQDNYYACPRQLTLRA